MKTVVALVGLGIIYAILQQQLPCNFSVTCLAGMPTFHQSVTNGWNGKPKRIRLDKLFPTFEPAK
jgi:hypothetical protein